MRKKALLVTSVLIVILALVLVTVIGCTPEEVTYPVTLDLGDDIQVRNLTDLKVAPVAPTKEGYEFDDWYTDAELQNKATFPMELKSELTLYAKYLQKFTLTLVSPGADNTTQSVAKLKLAPTAPEREGYTFQGWYLDSNYRTAVTYPYILEKDTTFYAKWSTGTESGYTVTFVTNGGTPVDNMVCTRINTLPVTTKTGMVFAGWYTSSRLVGNPVTFPYNVTKDITLYAKWAEDEGDKEYEYIKEYKNAKSSLETIFGLFPDPQTTATLDLQTTMTTDSGTAQIDMQGNFVVGGQNEFMFRVTMLDKTTFAVYFIGNDMYMDLGDGNPLVHFSDIKPDYVVAFLGDLLVDLDVNELLDSLKDSIGGIDIAGTLINLLFNSPYYTATKRLADDQIINESYQFEIKLNSLVSSINTLIGMFDIGSLIGINLNLTPLFDWLNSNIPQLKVYMYADTEYDETAKKTVVTQMQLVAEDNDPDNDVEGQVFGWIIDKADIRTTDPIDFTSVIADIENEETRDFSLSNIQFDLDLQLYSDENGLDVAKLVNLFAPDLGLPEDTLVLHSEFGYRIKANIDLDLNYLESEDDNNLIALEIYAVDRDGNIILNDKVPMLLGIYYRNGSLYVSLNSMMPNYWKADNIRVDGINLKGVVSYLVDMVTTAIDGYFGTDWDDYKTGAKELSLSQSGRDIVTIADDETTGEEVVYITPTIQTLITAVASVVGFEECLYANDDQIIVEVNQKLFAAINQFMGDSPIELPIALDGKVALNMFDEGLESVEITATVGVPDKDEEGNNVVDAAGNIVTSDPIEVKLKAHNFMLGFTQNEFTESDAATLAEYIDEKLALTDYESNLGNLLRSVLSGVDLNARAKVTFNEGTYAIGKFLENLGLKELEGVPLEWTFTEDFYMNVGLSVMISIDRNTRANSMFAIEITALEDISVGGMTGMTAGTVMLGVYGFYTQDASTGTGEWKPYILLDLSNVKIMNITLPKLSIEFDFVQTLLDLFDKIKIGDQLLNDFDLELDIMSLLGGDDSSSGEVSESALFTESDGTAAGTTLSDFGSIILGLNAEKVYASLTLGAVGKLLNQVGVDLGGFDLSTIDLAIDMDITRTEGWTITAAGDFMQPEEENQSQNFLMEIEIGTEDYPFTVGYVRDKLTETKDRVVAAVSSYTDDLIRAIIDTVGFMSIDVTMDLATYDSHIDFTKIINNILVSQGQYLDLPIDMYLDDWNSVSTVTLQWDLDLEVVTNSKLLLAFKYGEKEILSLGITGGDIIIDLSGLGLFAFKLSNSNLVSLLIGYLDDMIANIGDLNLTDIINGLLSPEENVQLDEIAGEIAQGLNMAEPAAEEEGDQTMDLIMMLLTGVHAENVSLFVDLTAPTIDKIFSSLLGIGLGFDIDLGLELDMVDGEINLGLGLSDVVDFNSAFKLQVGKQSEDDEVIVNTSVPDVDATNGATMAKTLLDNLDIALSIDVLSNNIDTGGSAKYLRLSVEKLKAQRVLADAAETPTVPAGALLVTIARVNADSDFNDTTSTSNTKALAYLALNYNAGKMSVYLAKNNINLVVDLGNYVAIDIDLDLVTTLGELFQGLIDQIDAAAQGTETAAMSAGGAEALALAEGDTAEEESPFSALFADLDVIKLLNGGIDVRLTSAGVFNIDVSFNAYEINKMIDGVMSLIFGPNTILNLAELAPDMFGSNYLANVNWDRVNNDSRGFWETLKAQLTPMLKEVLSNMVSSALAPLVTDTLLNSVYDEIHDILMRLLPLPVFNRLNVGITTLDGTFSNLYIKGYDDNQAVTDDDGTVLSHTTYNGGERTTSYTANSRNSNYKTEIYLFNKSSSVGSEDNTVSGESTPGIVDWGDITLSVNYEPYEYSGNYNATTAEEISAASSAAYSELYNKYFANKTARYQYNSTVQKSNVTFYAATKNAAGELVKGTQLTSSTVNALNVWQIAKDAASRGEKTATQMYVIGEASFSGEVRTLEITVNILPANEIRTIIPIETHAYDALETEITIELVTGEKRNIRTEDMATFTYAANSYTAHTKQVNVTFKNGVTMPMTVNFLDSTVEDIVGGGAEPNTYEIDLYDFTSTDRTIDRFTPEYLYIRYADGATTRIPVDQWVVPTESAAAIENKEQTDMTYISVPVQALIAQSTAAAQTVTLTVNVKTKVVSALGLGSTLDSLEINPYTYFLNMIGYSKETIKPDTAVAYYYEDRDGKVQSYNEQVNVVIDISTDTAGNQFNETNLSYKSEGKYGGTVSLDTSYYGARNGVDPETEGYDALESGYFKWSKNITVNVVKNSIIAVYFDEELTEEIFTVHPYEYNALDDEGKLAYFPDTAYIQFSSNAVMEMPIRWYDGAGNLLDPLTYVPDYESYSEQWQIEIGFLTEEYREAATQNGVNPDTLQTNFLQKANVGVFVDGMEIASLNIPGAAEGGSDYLEVDPIDVLYMGEDPFPSSIEVVYTDGTQANVGVYQWVGVDDIEITMAGSEVREITVMLTKDGLNNYTIRYKVVAKDAPIYAYDELVLDPFGYVTSTENGQTTRTYKEFGATLDVVFDTLNKGIETEEKEADVVTVNVAEWDFTGITFTSGAEGEAVAKVAKTDGTYQNVTVPVRMKTIAKKNGMLDLSYAYYGYDFVAVMYDTSSGVYFANFSEEIRGLREGYVDLMMTYWCEGDYEVYTGEITDDIRDDIITETDEKGEQINYIKVYTTRQINVYADFNNMPQNVNSSVSLYYLEDNPVDSPANQQARKNAYDIPVTFTDGGGIYYEYTMKGMVCVLGVSGTNTDASSATTGVSEGN